jgi:uncharacterized protein YeaO (DUF488 family)|tara:strand:+ start:111 stop:503 length:393 start_codon:yes stop_codon:yes gene_type:complete
MEGAVSIALFASNFSDLKFEYKALAPNWKILDKFKKKVISEEKFILAYKDQLNELNATSVVEHLSFLTGGEEPVLMCHCPKTKFCHRHLLADWLENKLGIHIQEFGSSDYIRKDGYLIKKEEPSLFKKED